MNIAFHNAVSGLMAFSTDLNNLSHQMANVNTYGYKPTRTSFEDLIYTNMNVNHNYDAAAAGVTEDGTEATNTENTTESTEGALPSYKKFLTGHGTKAAYLDLSMEQGIPIHTGLDLDVAIVGDGFFKVQKPDGSLEYTRSGAFDISVEKKKGYLVTSDGSYVLDAKGKKIELDRLKDENNKDTQLFDLSKLTSFVGVYSFTNPFGLEQTTGSCFKETVNSGKGVAMNAKSTANQPYELKQKYLEGSGVNLAQTMVDVMNTQRAFQMNSKIVQTADQVEEIINNLR